MLMALPALHMHALEQCIVVLCSVCITECSVAVHFNPMVLVRAWRKKHLRLAIMPLQMKASILQYPRFTGSLTAATAPVIVPHQVISIFFAIVFEKKNSIPSLGAGVP